MTWERVPDGQTPAEFVARLKASEKARLADTELLHQNANARCAFQAQEIAKEITAKLAECEEARALERKARELEWHIQLGLEMTLDIEKVRLADTELLLQNASETVRREEARANAAEQRAERAEAALKEWERMCKQNSDGWSKDHSRAARLAEALRSLYDDVIRSCRVPEEHFDPEVLDAARAALEGEKP